jgi:hypothetical protein
LTSEECAAKSNPEYKADIDVLSVRGLTGDRERTWTHPDALKSWPEFLLPNGFPNARILTFGYDAYVVRKSGPATLNRIRDHATDLLNALARYRASKDCASRPIIIVAHSPGGLLCKDAVLLSNASSDPASQGLVYKHRRYRLYGYTSWRQLDGELAQHSCQDSGRH